LKGTFINTIGDGYPIAIDTVEYPNGAHYNNHPNRSTVIGHWRLFTIQGVVGV
jgi:hypothetical protein